MPLEMNREVFVTCAVTGSGSTQDRSPHVPRSPKQIADSVAYEKEKFLSLDEASTPEELAGMVRVIIATEITDMFRSDRPAWHVPVMYQLFQRDDALYEVIHQEVMLPSIEAMTRFLRIINPDMEMDEIYLHCALMKMPIYAHADYMKTMLKVREADSYSDAYLQKMEDMLVRQAQLLLGLPEDKPKI